MSVPKGRRKLSKFEAQHNYYKLRDTVTQLAANNFNIKKKKYDAKIERIEKEYLNGFPAPYGEICAKAKVDAYNTWLKEFIEEEKKAVLDILRKIETEFTCGNSIYVKTEQDFLQRRKHISEAIGQCNALKQEIHYIIRSIPVGINKYERFAELIDYQITLYKGVRNNDYKRWGNLVKCDEFDELR